MMDHPQVAVDLAQQTQIAQLQRELSLMPDLRSSFDALAFQRVEELIGQHERYYRAVGTEARSGRLHVVEPVIPMDILGLYVFLPVDI